MLWSFWFFKEMGDWTGLNQIIEELKNPCSNSDEGANY